MARNAHEFMDELRSAGGLANVLWSCKKNPTDKHDNVFYVSCYGLAIDGKGHPAAATVILNEFDIGKPKGGLEVLFSSPHRRSGDDIKQILAMAVKDEPKPSTRLHQRIGLYPGHNVKAEQVGPDWVGTVAEYWENNADHVLWGDISEMLKDLSDYGYHNIGGGASGCFTVRYAL